MTFSIQTHTLKTATGGQGDVVDLTPQLRKLLHDKKITNGLMTVFVVGSTAGLSTTEFEPGLVSDLGEVFEKICPREHPYQHHQTWGCDNGSSHLRATMIGPSLVIPFSDGDLPLGTWQQVVLLEFDTQPRQRKIVVQIMGE